MSTDCPERYAGSPSTSRSLRVGIIGCGEIAQVVHIPTLNFLADFFQITFLCDASPQALKHCSERVGGKHRPQTSESPEDLCASRDVDAVLVCSATALHVPHAVLALKHQKHVFVEKPLTLCVRDLDVLASAENTSKGKVFVGYMRRYAPAFLDVLQEVGDLTKVQYVRIRDIIGPNADFIGQSGTFPKKFNDASAKSQEELSVRDHEIMEKALVEDMQLTSTDTTLFMLFALGGLGCHDLSAMRELFGMPKAVRGAVLQMPVWTAIFEYDNFPVVYESGVTDIPDFDCHIEIYMPTKIVRIKYDTPYIKGLPTTVTIRERVTGPLGDKKYQERVVRATYEDSYTCELREWHRCVTHNHAPKTGIADSREDLHVYKMLMQAAFGDSKSLKTSACS